MTREHRWMVVASTAAAIVVVLAGDWFAGQLIKPDTPGRLAYAPEGLPPPVDLVSVQRDWPAGLGAPGGRNRLVSYMHDVEGSLPSPSGQEVAAKQQEVIDLGTLLANADADTGKAKAQVCQSCHNFDQGGRDGVGPNLWGIAGRNVAARSSFSYSSAMAAQTGSWTYDRLFTYLASPARAMPGTKMSFAGLRKPEDRAAVIKFLATLGSNPPPLPQPAADGG